MTSDNELRDAFGSLGATPASDTDTALAGLRPRMRRHRIARTSATALPFLAAGGIAVALIAGGGQNPVPIDSVSATQATASALATAEPAVDDVADA